jgi:polysaccharide biosynthesis protein PslH
MKCLWLTLADPEPPENGQYLYSGGLIEAVASAGIELDVVGLSRPGAGGRDSKRTAHTRWWLAKHRVESKRAALFSGLPQVVLRTKTLEMQRIVRELLARELWDAIVFDSIAVGWALSMVRAVFRADARRPRLIYLSHNHEENVARHIADSERAPLKRKIKQLDALKVARLERRLVRNADIITSNSPPDCEQFRKRWPGKPISFLPPGYRGLRVVERQITSDVPRRAIIVGSFDWLPKRVSLEAFLRVADPLFAQSGIELHIVGSAEESYLRRLRQTVVATTLTGRVDDIGPHMAEARLALVPDRLGGFKLKALDYVFNRLPVLAIDGSVPGMPLRSEESILLCGDHPTLADRVVKIIDDVATLNRIQNAAYSACRDEFDWTAIARRLISAMSFLEAPEERVGLPLPTTG